MTERGSNIVAAGAEAWRAWREAEGEQLERTFSIGRALMEGRRRVMAETGAERPTGGLYNRGFSAWCDANGFDDVPTHFRGAAMWLTENEAEARDVFARHAALRSQGEPSAWPPTLRLAVIKARVAEPTKRLAPMQRPAALAKTVRTSLEAMPPADRIDAALAIAEQVEAVLAALGDDVNEPQREVDEAA